MLVREDLLSTNLLDIDFSRLERRVVARLLGRRVEGWPRIPAGPAHPVQRKRAVLRRVMAERRETTPSPRGVGTTCSLSVGMPLPSTAFDPVRWESRTADKYGLVDIDSNRYLAGPDSARSRVLAAIRWDTVTLTSPATGELFAEYPRQYGRSRPVEDPALVLPRLAVKPRAWRESSIRPDVPDDIRAWLDSMDEKTLRESLKAIGDACRAAEFDPAMQACGEILRSNRDMGLHADSLTPIALRMRDGEWEYPGGIEEPDLSGYDRFITGTDDGGEER